MRARLALPWLQSLGGLAILALLVWSVGTGPFLDGLRVVDPGAVLAALCIGVLTTLCSAWRWQRVAAVFGVDLPLGEAVEAYYRSQFLNATLPTGVAGDVHRAVRHGRAIGDLGVGAKAVVLERTASLVAQVTIAASVLLVLPSPLRGSLPLAAAVVVAVMVVSAIVARSRSIDRTLLVVVVSSSGLALTGHLVVFLVAARAAGSPAPMPDLVAPTLLALLAMALPLSLAGWGPREGVAAWAFGAAGLGAAQGVTTAVAYGVLSLVACLPGAAVLIRDALRSVPVAVPQGGAHD